MATVIGLLNQRNALQEQVSALMHERISAREATEMSVNAKLSPADFINQPPKPPVPKQSSQ